MAADAPAILSLGQATTSSWNRIIVQLVTIHKFVDHNCKLTE